MSPLRELRSLTLHGNPLQEQKGYRLYLMTFLPSLNQVRQRGRHAAFYALEISETSTQAHAHEHAHSNTHSPPHPSLVRLLSLSSCFSISLPLRSISAQSPGKIVKTHLRGRKAIRRSSKESDDSVGCVDVVCATWNAVQVVVIVECGGYVCAGKAR